jgi:DNA-directed RNA polymerase II subunit RPB1
MAEREQTLARDALSQYVQKSLKVDNNVKQMVVAGLQQRTLSHFTKDKFSPEGDSFVEDPYLRVPQELLHAMS